MPELGEQMYCSEQICIPPAFPYLLRQFAKAAIRTQPSDLLRWSTAYFRCLSLNIPPPVKPRLEYPIPRDYCGVTPGWLKALMYQLQNNLTISFKILWDRWTGACLEHSTLIQILCLGGFTDPEAIPWFRFIGLCAAHLTDDLTHTMILICEIMTEEPDGGSAMVPLETFTDLYKFLAAIDASKPQVLKNYYFTDALLTLWKEAAEKEEGQGREVKEESISEEESVKTEICEETEEEVLQKTDSKEVISCPSIAGDDDFSMNYHVDVGSKEASEEGEQEGMTDLGEAPEETKANAEEEAPGEEEEEIKEEQEGEEEEEKEAAHPDEEEGKPDAVEEEFEKTKVEALPAGEKAAGSVNTVQEQPKVMPQDVVEDDRTLKEDLARLQILQTEMAGESDTEIEEFKCRLIDEMPLTKSQEEAVLHFKDDQTKSLSESVDLKSEVVEEEEEDKSEEVTVNAVVGIGPVVPEELVNAVCKYMKRVASLQHGMIMPRNIRHYNCPPLEVLEY
ncbi:neurofilament medium polypeptide-like isoform X1 [Anoplophora glabripennis]|uniref:neurofilament medium polypeptide-like isoform X1 n=1 Tax=Anoplophora glabripennis TaxID=217634 RepID=UPI000873839D|nr:neurofilament medium polypeptide-like isoform X1 [Anoplophora glabripennis]